ncbi:MAG: gamma-glutamyl-gamma-aminobutyrate hydrolase family protein [Odoribacter sp.]|nr:gamma-glutamyl-gamma-aminobutyrate hydrolase family protein [Odoribacter sp.]
MIKKPRIGISMCIYTVENGRFAGMERAYVNKDYIEAVEKAGGIPLLLPSVDKEESIKLYTEICDGFIFSGRGDINPMFYHCSPHVALGPVNSALDKANLRLINSVLKTDKPILAICRGHQLLNVACGGTLFQDLVEIPGQILCHSQPAGRTDRIHRVDIAQNSILGDLLGAAIYVNSFHHQSIRDLGKGLRTVATTVDGVIEGIQMDTKPFVLGIQWHPEMLLAASDDMLPLFERLIQMSGVSLL